MNRRSYWCTRTGRAALKMETPTLCSLGFVVDDPRCPYVLGNGIGPKPYQHLHRFWSETQKYDSTWFETNASGASQIVKKLYARMQACNGEKHHEGVLSTLISTALQELMPIFGKAIRHVFHAVHQVFVHNKSSAHVDVGILDCTNDRCTIHALLEVKWAREDNTFPEAEAAAYSSLFFENNKINPHWWIPIFVLSKTHFKIGVAFNGIGQRWAYSEIFEKTGLSDNPFDHLQLLQFTYFMMHSANVHRVYEVKNDLRGLVDASGDVIFHQETVIGARVLFGVGSDKKEKTLKFYGSYLEAQTALDKQKAIQSILKVETKAKLCMGCSKDGICVLVDDYHKAVEVTHNHFCSLVEQVDALYKQSMVHGDLRWPNTVFGEGGRAILIDFDWAGKVGEAEFPALVNKDSFGAYSSSFVGGGRLIPARFDWLCLADLLKAAGNVTAAEAAAQCDADKVKEVLLSVGPKEKEDLLSVLPAAFGVRSTSPQLDLSQLGIMYYCQKRFRSQKRKRSDDDQGSAQQTVSHSQSESQSSTKS